jgi:hypothetical protein
LTNSKPKKTFEERLVAIRDSLTGLGSHDDGVNGEDKDDKNTEPGQLCEDDEPCWVLDTITKIVQQCVNQLQQEKMMFD